MKIQRIVAFAGCLFVGACAQLPWTRIEQTSQPLDIVRLMSESRVAAARVPAPVPEPEPARVASVTIPGAAVASAEGESALQSGPHWNAWAVNEDGETVGHFEGERRYEIFLDISPYLYRAQHGARTAAPVAEYIRNFLSEGKNTLYFKVRIIPIDPALRLTRDNREEELKVDLRRLKSPSLEAGRVRSIGDFDDLVLAGRMGELSATYSAGLISVSVATLPKTGCAQIAFAISDASGERPLDHVVYSLPIKSRRNERITTETCPVPAMQGGFSSLAPTESESKEVDAALHIFQYDRLPQPVVTAVYVDLKKYRSQSDGALRQRGIYSWNLLSDPRQYMTTGLPPLVLNARRLGDYAAVAEELKLKVFPGRQGSDAALAFDSLVGSMKSSSRAAQIQVRVVMRDGTHVYLPLGMLAAKSDKGLKVVYPMPRDEPNESACIGNWTIGIPEKLEGVVIGEKLKLSADDLAAERMDRVSTTAGLRQYLDGVGGPAAEAFVLLAHQSKGYFWFEGLGNDSRRIPVEANNRVFPRGSVVFLNVCSAADPGGGNMGMLERFNENGVDAMVLSPFAVDTEYGTALALATTRVVKAAYDANEELTVSEILERAQELVLSLLPNARFTRMGMEFLLIGNHRLRLCKNNQ